MRYIFNSKMDFLYWATFAKSNIHLNWNRERESNGRKALEMTKSTLKCAN